MGKVDFKIPKEYYTWVLENHPDPDNTLGYGNAGEFMAFQMWHTCQRVMNDKSMKAVHKVIDNIMTFDTEEEKSDFVLDFYKAFEQEMK